MRRPEVRRTEAIRFGVENRNQAAFAIHRRNTQKLMSLTYQPFAVSPQLGDLQKSLSINVNAPERAVSAFGGAALVLAGLSRRSLGGALLALAGVALFKRGVTGHCGVYQSLNINSRSLQEPGVPGNKGQKVVKSVTISRPRAEVYSFWRKLDNLPAFMSHLEKVEVLDDQRSRWTVHGPAGSSVEWEAEIINEHQDQMLAWQSLPGADVQNAGSVWFEDAPNGGTEVRVSLEYLPPAGAIGAAVAKLFGESPDVQLQEDLGRLKEQLEGGRPVAA